MLRVLRAEFLKLRRARVVMWTAIIVVFFASMTAWGTEIWAPDAPIEWESVLRAGTTYAAGWWGVLLLGMATAHLFGSEFSDGTASSMLTTPIRREYFVIAKLVVLAVWAIALILVSFGAHMVVGVIQGADGFDWAVVRQNLADGLLVALLLYLTLPVTALVSMLGRGYVAPMLFATAMMAASWTCGFLGWSRWFPWAMPATVAGGMGPPSLAEADLTIGSWAIALTLFVAGLVAVFVYVNRAGEVT